MYVSISSQKHKKLIQELANLSQFELFWSGRLASYKKLILPQILYLFRTLAVPFQQKSYLYSTICSKTSSGKAKGQDALSLLLKHRGAGDTRLVDVKDYYLAARLDQIKNWFNPVSSLLWTGIKQILIQAPDLYTLLIAHLWQPFPLKGISPPIKTLLLAWRALLTTPYSEIFDTSVHIPIDVLPYPVTMLPWVSKGIQVINDISIDGRLHDLEELRQRFGITSNDHYTYYRIQHLLKYSPPPELKLLKKLLKFYLSTPTRRKGISLIYNKLQEKLIFHKSKPFSAMGGGLRFYFLQLTM